MLSCNYCGDEVRPRAAVHPYQLDPIKNPKEVYCSSECLIDQAEELAQWREERNRLAAKARSREIHERKRSEANGN